MCRLGVGLEICLWLGMVLGLELKLRVMRLVLVLRILDFVLGLELRGQVLLGLASSLEMRV